jgi:hypothetical protein
MSVISRRTGKPSTPTIRHAYALKKDGSAGGVQDKTNGVNSHDNSVVGDEIVLSPPLDDADRLQNLIHFAEWAEGAIDTQKKDIDRISASVSKIEKDMRSFKDFMTMVRKELSMRPTNIEMDEVRSSVSSLRDEMDDSRFDRRATEGSLSFDDVDLMTESIATISHKVSEFDPLKLEVQLLKSRLKRFEDDAKEAGFPVESRVRGTPAPATPRRPHESPAYVKPLVETLQRTVAGIEKRTLDAIPPETESSKRRRISGEDILGPPASRVRSGSLARKPSRLSNVQLPKDSPERPEADVGDLGGTIDVEVSGDDSAQLPKPANKRLSEISGIQTRSNATPRNASPVASTPIQRDQSQNKRPATPPNKDQSDAPTMGSSKETPSLESQKKKNRGGDRRSQAYIMAAVQKNVALAPGQPKSTPKRDKKSEAERNVEKRAKGHSREFDVDGCPLTANGTRDKRFRTGNWMGKQRDRRKKKEREENTPSEEMVEEDDGEETDEDEREMNDERPEKIVPSVEKDDMSATRRTATHPRQSYGKSAEGQQQTRQETLAERERLVKETIEREMNMGT